MQTACMPSITIRDVPAATRDELASRAARSGRSLQEYLRGELIALGERPDLELLADRVRQRKRAVPSTITTAEIVEHLHADRR